MITVSLFRFSVITVSNFSPLRKSKESFLNYIFCSFLKKTDTWERVVFRWYGRDQPYVGPLRLVKEVLVRVMVGVNQLLAGVTSHRPGESEEARFPILDSIPIGWKERMEREREMFYLPTHSTHFIYGYMASDIWLRTILIVRKETCCRHIGYSYRLTARVLLYAPSHRRDNTYHGLCYTSRGALAETRNSSMGPPHEGSIRRPTAP